VQGEIRTREWRGRITVTPAKPSSVIPHSLNSLPLVAPQPPSRCPLLPFPYPPPQHNLFFSLSTSLNLPSTLDLRTRKGYLVANGLTLRIIPSPNLPLEDRSIHLISSSSSQPPASACPNDIRCPLLNAHLGVPTPPPICSTKSQIPLTSPSEPRAKTKQSREKEREKRRECVGKGRRGKEEVEEDPSRVKREYDLQDPYPCVPLSLQIPPSSNLVPSMTINPSTSRAFYFIPFISLNPSTSSFIPTRRKPAGRFFLFRVQNLCPRTTFPGKETLSQDEEPSWSSVWVAVPYLDAGRFPFRAQGDDARVARV